VGGIGLNLKSDVHRKTAEVGYWLGEAFWGRGIAPAALRALTQYSLKNFDLHRLEAGVFAWNHSSMRVLEKVGYVREATLRKACFKDGELIDLVLYAFVRER
jgi:RimJ/RimL family protein N-acetyltransferase